MVWMDFELMVGNRPRLSAKNPDASRWSLPDGSYAPGVPLFAGKRILTPEVRTATPTAQ